MHTRARSSYFGLLVLPFLAPLAGCSSPRDERSQAPAPSSEAPSAAPIGRPVWATASNFEGRLEPTSKVAFQVHLPMKDVAAARAELASIGDPESPSFRHFLSDAEFDSKYGPTDADVAAVRAHFEGQGLKLTEAPANRAYLAFEGTAAEVESAFSMQLGRYVVHGVPRRAPLTEARLPASVAPHVAAVAGVTTHTMKPLYLRSDQVVPADVTSSTCSVYFGQKLDTTDPPVPGYPSPLPYAPCPLKPAEMREAYGLNTLVRRGNDGRGQKIAIVDAFTPPTLVQDLQTYFASEDADYPLAASQITLVQGPGTPQPLDTGWYTESDMDIEAAHAIAPGADIVYVGAVSGNDVDLIAAVNAVVTGRLATIISNSYGDTESHESGVYTAWESLAIQAGLKGIGLYFASGDWGDNFSLYGDRTAFFPATLPEVTAVGGTSMALNADGSKAFELGWEPDLWLLQPDTDGGSTWSDQGYTGVGSGGGWSEVHLQPSYQAGVVPTSVATSPVDGTLVRVTPDVAMSADPGTGGYLVGGTFPPSGYREFGAGGTSLATPLFAATMALAQQRSCQPFGPANALLYKASKKGAFTDIVPSASPIAVAYPPLPPYPASVVVLDYHGAANTISTAVGFDTVTGLGAPNPARFFSFVK